MVWGKHVMNQPIAFLGLGVMGSAMAANLARAGYSVMAWNRTPDRPGVATAAQAGATIAASIRAAVAAADVIFLCLGDIPDVKAVILGVDGVANFARSGALIVDTSTIGPDAAKELAKALEHRHLRFLDAPISGGDIGARNGTLTIMVGGDRNDFEACKPLLEAIGKTIRLCGPVGSGQAVKLCNQALVSAYMVGICEAMLLAEQMHIDPSTIVEVCGSGAAASWALTNLGMKVARSDFQPGFAIQHMLKDLRILQENNRLSGVELPGVELAEQLFQIANALDGGSEQGTQAMIRAYRETK